MDIYRIQYDSNTHIPNSQILLQPITNFEYNY